MVGVAGLPALGVQLVTGARRRDLKDGRDGLGRREAERASHGEGQRLWGVVGNGANATPSVQAA